MNHSQSALAWHSLLFDSVTEAQRALYSRLPGTRGYVSSPTDELTQAIIVSALSYGQYNDSVAIFVPESYHVTFLKHIKDVAERAFATAKQYDADKKREVVSGYLKIFGKMKLGKDARRIKEPDFWLSIGFPYSTTADWIGGRLLEL